MSQSMVYRPISDAPADATPRRFQRLSPDPTVAVQSRDGANNARLRRLQRILLVVDRRCRASKIEDLVHLDKKRMGDVVAQQLEAFVVEQMLNIMPCSGEEVVHAQHLAPKL
jgi:hypothetical protein